jgi:cytidylate kinase
LVVAIDGPAGVGKSTVARRVAESLGFLYLNSGSFYRAVTWAVLESGRDPADAGQVLRTARECRFDVRDGALLLGGKDLEDLIRTDAVDAWVARHSAIPEVRGVVNTRLREIALGADIVMDGRDIGTVVFPDAEVKVFLDADTRTRAERRFRQGVSGLALEEIERAIEERDLVDRTKPVGRLARAADAIALDTSHLTIGEVCERVTEAILVKQNNPGDIRGV